LNRRYNPAPKKKATVIIDVRLSVVEGTVILL
jgi:hypothetical protein